MTTLLACTGFEFGTSAGWVAGNPGTRLMGYESFSGVAPDVVSTDAHTGSYCLEIPGPFKYVGFGEETFGISVATTVVGSVWLKIVSSTGTVNVADLGTNRPSPFYFARLKYDTATSRLGVQVAAGTIVWQTGTTPAGVWVPVEWRYTVNVVPYTLDWRVDDVEQAQATSQAGLTAGFIMESGLGSDAGGTCVTRFDDFALSAVAADYPLGNFQVVTLTPDPADPVTLSGTAANFSTFTANGTLSAWNATVAQDNISELPPALGAAADGFAQVTAATADYAEIPLTSYTLIPGQYVIGGRLIVCGWAASTTAATLGFRSWNGTTERILSAGTTDQNFDNTSVDPAWYAELLTYADIARQADLDQLAIRVGFSSDASPAIGPHTVQVELLIGAVGMTRVLSIEDDAFTVDYQFNPVTDAPVAYLVTTPPGTRGATFNLVISGTPISRYVDPGSEWSEFVEGVDISTVSYITLTPDPG